MRKDWTADVLGRLCACSGRLMSEGMRLGVDSRVDRGVLLSDAMVWAAGVAYPMAPLSSAAVSPSLVNTEHGRQRPERHDVDASELLFLRTVTAASSCSSDAEILPAVF